MVCISLLHYSRREAIGPSSLALDCDAMAQPRGNYSMVQVSIDICASAAPPDDPWTVEHLLQHFHLEGCQCEVNDLIYPMMSGPGRYLMPSIESLEQHWVSWDEPLVPDRRVLGPFVKESCFARWQMHRRWSATSALWVTLILKTLTFMFAWSCISLPQWQ